MSAGRPIDNTSTPPYLSHSLPVPLIKAFAARIVRREANLRHM